MAINFNLVNELAQIHYLLSNPCPDTIAVDLPYRADGRLPFASRSRGVPQFDDRRSQMARIVLVAAAFWLKTSSH